MEVQDAGVVEDEPPDTEATSNTKSTARTDKQVIVIASTGDVVLEIIDEPKDRILCYQVDTKKLRNASPYFNQLLQPGRFREGGEVATQLERLILDYGDVTQVPLGQLPIVRVEDVGHISQVSTVQFLMQDFLRMLHGLPLSTPRWPLVNLANLAVVTDRFDALGHAARYMSTHGIARRIKPTQKSDEEIIRQRLLVGLLFEDHSLLHQASHGLILMGSSKWISLGEEDDDPALLWWDLPQGMEQELRARHFAILHTIDSLVQSCLNTFSTERCCKLFFENSLQCDSFQLGEFMRFLRRHNLIACKATFTSTTTQAASPPTQDIARLMDTLRQCPSYQIDRNHHHCGPKKQLSVGLDYLQRVLAGPDIGISLGNWQQHRASYAWASAKRLPLFIPRGLPSVSHKRQGARGQRKADTNYSATYAQTIDFFTATDRDWSVLLRLEGAPSSLARVLAEKPT